MGNSKNNSSQSEFAGLVPTVPWERRSREEILADVRRLLARHRRGELGGQVMPEDAHPPVSPDSARLYHYFTLGMALNYQRNSYALWKAATATFLDADTACVFDPKTVAGLSDEELRKRIVRHRLALQPQKQTAVWRRICKGICELLDGDVRQLFRQSGRDVLEIRDFVQREHKSSFPYLSGPKIVNYWLFVMDQYTDAKLVNRRELTVAPDTHVVQSSIRLGLVAPSVRDGATVAQVVSAAWSEVLAGTDIAPIDVHTPLWLWSRSGFIGDP